MRYYRDLVVVVEQSDVTNILEYDIILNMMILEDISAIYFTI